MLRDDDQPDVVYVAGKDDSGEVCFEPQETSKTKVDLGKNHPDHFSVQNHTGQDLVFQYAVDTVKDADKQPIRLAIKPFDFEKEIEVKNGTTEIIKVRRGTGIPKDGSADGKIAPNDACPHPHRGHTDWHIDC